MLVVKFEKESMGDGADNTLPTASPAAAKLLPNAPSILLNLIETLTSLIAFSGEENFWLGKIFSSTSIKAFVNEEGLRVPCLLSEFRSDKVLSLLVSNLVSISLSSSSSLNRNLF